MSELLSTARLEPIQPISHTPGTRAWQIKFVDPSTQQAFWIRMGTLISENGFRQRAETTVLMFGPGSGGSPGVQLALRQAHEYVPSASAALITFGGSEMTTTGSSGQVLTKAGRVEWKLRFERGTTSLSNPDSGLSRRRPAWSENFRVSGEVRINDEAPRAITDLPCMLSYSSDLNSSHPWSWSIWGHCNSFVDEKGAPESLEFQGLTTRTRAFGIIPGPRLSSFKFVYKGETYRFNSLIDSLRMKSSNNFNAWHFQADRGDLSFRGHASFEHRKFAGLTSEDSRGVLLYSSLSALSDLEIHVYRGGKLEKSLFARGTAAFELNSRQKNPYVPALL